MAQQTANRLAAKAAAAKAPARKRKAPQPPAPQPQPQPPAPQPLSDAAVAAAAKAATDTLLAAPQPTRADMATALRALADACERPGVAWGWDSFAPMNAGQWLTVLTTAAPQWGRMVTVGAIRSAGRKARKARA